MGGGLSQVFRSGSSLTKNSSKCDDYFEAIFEILRANPKTPILKLEFALQQIPKNECLSFHDEYGYNILQKAVGLNHIELTKWLLHRHRPDVNRSLCSLPLHIACLKGYEECVDLLLKYGARIDTEARMCFSGVHSPNCEESGKYRISHESQAQALCSYTTNKLQNAIFYAVDGDQINVLNMLIQKMEEPWVPFRAKKPLLHLACERGAFRCVQQLVITRSEEINLIKDEFYPIHHAVLKDVRFIELLINHGANVQVSFVVSIIRNLFYLRFSS